jgi:hypothetical protein
MQRRGWGAVVLAVAVILAVAVSPAFGPGNRISGQGVRQPIPPPPAVGDCLLSAVDPDGSVQQYIAGSIGSASVGACSAGVDRPGPGNFGEIVSVAADQQSFPRSGGGRTSIPDPQTCQPPAAGYLDWPDPTWAPVTTRKVFLLGPDISQYQSGQRWLACAIAPADDAYLGSLRDEGNRSAANAYGQCRSLSAPGPKRVPCAQPHEIEIFGTALGDDADANARTGSCASLLTAVTRMPEPTVGGQLEVLIVPDRLLGRRNCEVRVLGDRLLHESLLGWGPEPLPFA